MTVKGVNKTAVYYAGGNWNSSDETVATVDREGIVTRSIVPAGYEGEFLLIIKGIGNYSGSIRVPIYVSDRDHMIKNAKVTVGKNLKTMEYKGNAVKLTPGVTDSADVFTVKIGKTVLMPVKDYSVCYRSNNKIGKAEMIIIGAGEYVGSKSVFFNIKGKPLTAKTIQIEGVEDKFYTGAAWEHIVDN